MTRDTTRTSETEAGRDVAATLRRVVGVLGLVLVIAVVLPFVVFAVPQVVGADHGFVILSGSMEPAVSPGDVVIVDASASVGVGDVITFDDGNEIPTTHRVVGVQDGQYVTKGDANENADSRAVPPDAVLGRVTLTIPLIGYLILWVNTPLGYVGLVLVPIGLLLLTELWSYARGGSDDEDGSAPASSGPTPAIRRVDDLPPADATAARATTGASPGSTPVAAADLKLTALATAALFGYATWNVYGEVTAGIAPSPVSVAAMTGGFLGLLLAAWVTGTKWLARRSDEVEAEGEEEEEEGAKPDSGGVTPTGVADGSSMGDASAAQTDGGSSPEGDS